MFHRRGQKGETVIGIEKEIITKNEKAPRESAL
jgi:hypothetical protein